MHAVLEAYGRDPAMRQLEDPEAIHAATTSLLAAEAAARFGSPTRGTVALQLKQAEHRLLHFAQDQAQEMAQGWRIHAVEWSPSAGSVPLSMDGVDFSLRGVVDRIDRREVDGRVEWRILDYKTADRPYDKKHCVGSRTKRWADVQLALYPALTAETTGPPRLEVGREDLQVGYWNLGIGEGREHGITRIEF
ncbi:MAG: PD-(D/E)XK nuclease family protein, partial [Planctomycetota bacterium]